MCWRPMCQDIAKNSRLLAKAYRVRSIFDLMCVLSKGLR